ncbi:MAG: RICIN domain-containing protein [Oscillospiraceae bacterium]|nr:RICIN domain-containing protein [Oscillospiraceae bacterium]
MKLRKFAAAAVSAVLSLTALHMQLPAADAADYIQNKSRVSVHDPSVIRDPASGMYYVFGSHIDAAKSADLQSWRTFTNGYARTNNQIFGDLSGNLKPAFAWAGEDLEDCAGGFAVWAPDVFWDADFINTDGTKGAYLMYFCTSSTYMRSVIAFAVSKNIEGPYTFADNLIYSGFTDTDSYATSATKNVNRKYTSTNIDELIAAGQVTFNNSWFNKHNFNNQLFPNAIDPTIYTDTEGRMYMCYGSWSGGIFTLEIDRATGRCIHPQTGTTADGRMVDSYFGTKISGGYGKSGEGPFIEYNAETGFYYLFVTYGGLTSTGGYNMRVGRSRSPLGPFRDPSGKDMVLPQNPDLNAVGLKLMTNYMIPGLQKAYMAPGHNSVLHDDDGQWYLVNHTRFDDGAEFHEVRVHAMSFNEDGWPVVMPYEYSGETWSESGYDPRTLTGTYEFINHGSGTDGKITGTQKITLACENIVAGSGPLFGGDMIITGAVTGTWKATQTDALAHFKIGNVDYTGRFNVQYDESGKRVMTFTAAGSNNQTIWGIKTDAWTGSEQDPVIFTEPLTALFTDENALPDQSGDVYISGTELLSNLPYFIMNRNSGLLLDADPQTGKIQQWEYGGMHEEAFRLTDLGNGYCRITPLSDESKCVTVQGSSAENGLDVSLAAYTGADNQQFRLVRSGMHYGIVSKCSGDAACLDVYEWSTENGGAVKQWEFWDGGCQLWDFTPTHASVPDHSYTLRSVDNGKYLSTANGTVTADAESKVWQLTLAEQSGWQNLDCYYTLQDETANALTVTENGGLALTPLNSGKEQQFKIVCNPDGSYLLTARSTNDQKCLDADGMKLSEKSGSDSQKFVLIPAEKITVREPEVTTTTTVTTTTDTTTNTTTEAVTTAAGRVMLGDTDCSGVVDVSDAVLLARYVTEDRDAVVSDQGRRNADCDRNGTPEASDVVLILRHIAKIDLLPGWE